jgi:hydroxyethylthiazole kinase-like sugar kinase family protein
MSRQEIIAMENAADLARGIVGSGCSLMAVIASKIDQIETWLRITSLLIGIAVGIATFISIWRRRR